MAKKIFLKLYKNKNIKAKMKIQTITQINNNQIVHTKKQAHISIPAIVKNTTSLNNFSNYGYRINFKGSDIETINKMQELVKSKNYDFEVLMSLFNKLSDKKKQNVKETAERFKKEGLTTNDYLEACIKRPQLFYQSPKTIEKNVRDLVKRFEKEGLSSHDYIKACIKLPPLFCLSYETMAEHIKAYMFVDKNNLGYKDKNIMEKILIKHLAFSTSSIYLRGLILPQMKKQNPEITKFEF